MINNKFIKSFFTDVKEIIADNSWHQYIYKIIYISTWILYIFSIFGISAFGESFFIKVQKFILIYVSLFLIIKFNPWVHANSNRLVSKFDKDIIFHAGAFILFSTLFNHVIRILHKTKKFTFERLFESNNDTLNNSTYSNNNDNNKNNKNNNSNILSDINNIVSI